MTSCPEKSSSICPLIMPSDSCCRMKYFCDFFTMKATSTPDTGITTTAIRVITGDMVSIITTTPTRVAMEVMIIVMLWFRPVPSVSTSFVIRERTSPYGRLSKYFIGIRSIFSAISRRIR